MDKCSGADPMDLGADARGGSAPGLVMAVAAGALGGLVGRALTGQIACPRASRRSTSAIAVALFALLAWALLRVDAGGPSSSPGAGRTALYRAELV